MNRVSTLAALATVTAFIGCPQTLQADSLDGPHHRSHVAGAGPLTVVFEAGLGDTLDVWAGLEPRIASHCARTFSYNRAGYAGSDTADADRDAKSIVEELRQELKRARIDRPYILVGHSLGGLYMQYFARNFPSEVKGLVLIDSTHWQQGLKVASSANTPYQARVATTLYMPWIVRRELNDSAQAGREVESSPAATSIPTVVLSSTRLGAGETVDEAAQAVAFQNSIAADFPQSRHVFVDNSGHYIQRDQPETVVDAIRALAGCALRP